MTDLIALDDQTRVWIYQADSFFDEDQIPEVKDAIFTFVTSWVSHNKALRTYGNIFHRRFICLFVDETQSGASGCSIDSSVRFINQLAAVYNKNLIEREHFAYIQDDEVRLIHMNELAAAYASKQINDETLFFDHLVKTKAEFIQSWLKPLSHSWHKRFI